MPKLQSVWAESFTIGHISVSYNLVIKKILEFHDFQFCAAYIVWVTLLTNVSCDFPWDWADIGCTRIHWLQYTGNSHKINSIKISIIFTILFLQLMWNDKFAHREKIAESHRIYVCISTRTLNFFFIFEFAGLFWFLKSFLTWQSWCLFPQSPLSLKMVSCPSHPSLPVPSKTLYLNCWSVFNFPSYTLLQSRNNNFGPALLQASASSFACQYCSFSFQIRLPALASSFGFQLWLPASASSFGFQLRLPASASSCGFQLRLPALASSFGFQLRLPASASSFGFQLRLPALTYSFGLLLRLPASAFSFSLELWCTPREGKAEHCRTGW